MILLNLFFVFFQIGIFSFGGAYVMIPLIQKEVINSNGWMQLSEFTNIIAIAEMTPGPISVNTATFVGYNVAGVLGAMSATLGVTMPCFIVVFFLAKAINKCFCDKTMKNIFSGIRPAIIGLIFGAAFYVGNEFLSDFKSIALGIIIFIALIKYKIHPVFLILISGLLGIILF